MNLIRSAVILFILIVAYVTVQTVTLAQQGQNAASRKFIEFSDINYETSIAFLDAFSLELRKEPTAKGYIVVSRSDRDSQGVNSRYALRAKNYLIELRGHSRSQIVAIDGGVSACLVTQLWIVPDGAATPDFTASSRNHYERVNLNFLRKFDEYEYYLPTDSDCGWCGYQDKASRLDAIAAELKSNPNLRAYIIAYAQYYEDQGLINASGRTFEKGQRYTLYDPAGTASRMLQNEKDYLTGTRRIAPNRIITIDGGHRVDRSVELWIAPTGTPAPKPNPTIYPKRRRKS